MGKFIAIDGVDASGKQTHTELLAEYFTSSGYKVRRLSFPMYDSESSALVKMYLSGKLGKNAQDIDAYSASTFYAADRFATYKCDWHTDYEDKDTLIIADRYVSSNMIHQACKIKEEKERNEFLQWINDFEFGLLKLPKPNLVVFLDMPVEASQKLANARKDLKAGTKKDIHENDKNHLTDAYNAGIGVCEKFGWCKVNCVDGEQIKSIEEIHSEIMEKVFEMLKKY